MKRREGKRLRSLYTVFRLPDWTTWSDCKFAFDVVLHTFSSIAHNWAYYGQVEMPLPFCRRWRHQSEDGPEGSNRFVPRVFGVFFIGQPLIDVHTQVSYDIAIFYCGVVVDLERCLR